MNILNNKFLVSVCSGNKVHQITTSVFTFTMYCPITGVTDWESLRPVESQATKVESPEIPSRSELNRFGNVRNSDVCTCKGQAAIFAIRRYSGAFEQLLPKQAKRRATAVVAEAGRGISEESQSITPVL